MAAPGGKGNSSQPDVFMGIDLNQIKYDENGEAKYGGLPGSGAVVLNSLGIVPFPKSKKKSPRDPVPVTHEVREVMIKKKNYFGMKLRNFEHGVFVSYVEEHSSAAKAGVRFGDQVLAIDGEPVAGMKGKQALEYALNVETKDIKERVPFTIRDRPLERVIELTKDHNGQIGIHIVDGRIVSIEPGSSAEREGVIINSQICEVEGVNAMGISDEDIFNYIRQPKFSKVRITVIPGNLYQKLSKRLDKRELKSMNRLPPKPL